MRTAATIAGALAALWMGTSTPAATLEKLSIDQMSQQSTIIVLGRVTGCAGELRRSVIYTRCGVAVSETWKGSAAKHTEFLVPGGTAQGLTQSFTGSPKFNANEQYVLFLWVGRSGIPQIVGLSQGVFDVAAPVSAKTARATRAPAEALMLDASGKPVSDEPLNLSVAELRERVGRALAGSR